MLKDKTNVIVLYYEVGKQPRAMMIPNQLSEMQNLVGGYIESLGLFDNVVLICNEEGNIFDLPTNHRVGNDIIAGNFFVTAADEEGDFIDLSEEQVLKTLSFFENKRI